MSHYKPSMKLVLAAYIEGLSESKVTKEALTNEFYRWLASVKAEEYRIGYNKATIDIVDEELSRERKADAWDECAQEARDLGWIYEIALAEMKGRNPYRGEQA